MPNYTKLFNSIVTSTIWTEDDKTRIVWITMLAMADQNGEVQASIPGLARLAAVTLEDVELAIDKLMSPDKYSRTPDHEGRRIEKIDGGWELLNHAKYRLMASKEDAKAANAARQRRHRERNATVTPGNATVTQGGDIAEAEVEVDTKADTKNKTIVSDETSSTLLALWNNSPPKARNRSSKKQVLEAWKKIKTSDRPDSQQLVSAIKAWSLTEDWQNGYAPGLHIWIKDEKWTDLPEATPDKSVQQQSLNYAKEL